MRPPAAHAQAVLVVARRAVRLGDGSLRAICGGDCPMFGRTGLPGRGECALARLPCRVGQACHVELTSGGARYPFARFRPNPGRRPLNAAAAAATSVAARASPRPGATLVASGGRVRPP